MRDLRRVHLWVGVIALAIFLGTGVYMTLQFPEAHRAQETVRYLFRASHVYILFVALLHLALAAYLTTAVTSGSRRVQKVASWLLVAAPLLLVWAFITEPPLASPDRPITLAGVIFALSGTVLHLVVGWRSQRT